MQRALFAKELARVQGIMVVVLVLIGMAQAVAKEKVLYRFQGGSDGSEPLGTLVADQAGNLYGTTTGGGTGGCQGGCGTVFELLPNPDGTWRETLLYEFTGGEDGAFPNAGLAFDPEGNLYGTTLHFGASGDGTVFRLSPPAKPGNAPWTETVLYNFVGDRDGEYCLGSLTFDKAGNLYGATLFGGTYGGGTIFQLAPQGGLWTLTVLHTFKGAGDGLDPWGPVTLDAHGVVYGVTSDGVIFRLRPPAPGRSKWTFRVLYDLPSLVGAGALLGGRAALYGTTGGGGANNSGTIFQLTPQPGQFWKLTTLYEFKGGADGSFPLNGLVADGAGNLYGVTPASDTSQGTVYRFSFKSGVRTKTTLYTFQGGSDGGDPESGVIVGPGVLYGTTKAGGFSDNGTVFQVGP